MYSQNRYYRKTKSKDKDRKRFLTHRWLGRSKYASWEDYVAHKPSWGNIVQPWHFYYGKSRDSKYWLRTSEKKLRSECKINILNFDEVSLPKRSQYKKGFDYVWMAW